MAQFQFGALDPHSVGNPLCLFLHRGYLWQKFTTMAKLNPYLNFNNQCREAMNFYKECLGGELFFQTVGELPAMAAKMSQI